jgi:uncharacterized protein with PIN domain
MRILLDAMLGGLRSYLRICGHDAAYALDRGVEADDELLAWAEAEDRTLFTRDAGLAGRAEESVVVESHDVEEQLRELRAAGVPLALADPPVRCGRCNGRLDRADAADAPAYAPDEVDELWRCRDCGQCFWKGSHWEDVRERLGSL